MIYLTSVAVTIQTDNLQISLNKPLTTETITLSGAVGGTFGVIGGAATSAGQQFVFTGLRSKGVITITPSAPVDAAVNQVKAL